MSILGLFLFLSISLQTPEIEQPTIQNPVQEQKIYLYEQIGNYPEYLLLSRIISCESSWRQTQDGEVLRGVVNNKDVGLAQINETYHLKKSQELNFNIYEWQGNLDYAIYLFKNYGTKPWNWSKKCWQGS